MPMLADWLTVLVIGCLAVISPGPNLAIILRNSLVYLRRPPRQVLVGEPHEQGFKIRTDGGSAPTGRFLKVHVRRTNSRCHFSKVSGLNRKTTCTQRVPGRTRLVCVSVVSFPARTSSETFSQRAMRGGCGCVRRRIRSWWRSRRIARSLSRSDRAVRMMGSSRHDTRCCRNKQRMEARGCTERATPYRRTHTAQRWDMAIFPRTHFPHATG